MPDIFWNDIKPILSLGRNCMLNVKLSTEEGVFSVDLGDYQSVKRFHALVAVALNGWQRDANGQWARDQQGNPIATRSHPMPPGGPLAVNKVDTFLAWINDGMPEMPEVA